MQGFGGFQSGQQTIVPVPVRFFSDLLPIIDHLGELQVTLYALWALSRKEGTIRWLNRHDFTDDPILMGALAQGHRSTDAALDEALERAVARGTLLAVTMEGAEGTECFYFLNSEKGRDAIDMITRGEWLPEVERSLPVSLAAERPNSFVLYEQNVGPLTPMIAEQLRDAEESYPTGWIEEAIQIAVNNNARSWAYISRILERWNAEGKKDTQDRRDTERDDDWYLRGEDSDIVRS
ncbi:MAG: DnaD domain protein [Chloroflexota bacterium]